MIVRSFRVDPPTGSRFPGTGFAGPQAADATCFMAVCAESKEVAGFYALAATSIALSALEPGIARKLPRYPVVLAALVGRLAVATSYQSKGLGSALLGDARAPYRASRAGCVRDAGRCQRRCRATILRTVRIHVVTRRGSPLVPSHCDGSEPARRRTGPAS